VYAVKSSAIGAPTSAGTVFKVEVTQTVGGKLAPCSAYASVQLDFGGGNSTTFCDAGNCITSKLFICNITVAAKYALSVLADGSAVTPKVAVTVVPTAIDARASHAFGPALAGGRAQDSLSFWIQVPLRRDMCHGCVFGAQREHPYAVRLRACDARSGEYAQRRLSGRHVTQEPEHSRAGRAPRAREPP
jgi:hypothetical protein